MSKLDTQIKKVLKEMSEEPEYGRLDRSLVQDVIDRLLSDETGGYRGALKALNSEFSSEVSKKYLAWGAGPRASQFLVLGAKCHAAINGKYSPDIEDVKAVANSILRHRIIRNYKAEADGMSIEAIIEQLK